MLATPVKPMEIAFGELMWAMARGAIYSVAFLVIMVLMHLTTAGLAIVAFLATGYALYLRYLAIEQPSVALACEAGLRTWLCTAESS